MNLYKVVYVSTYKVSYRIVSVKYFFPHLFLSKVHCSSTNLNKLTGRFVAGLPMPVSSTWEVMGGLWETLCKYHLMSQND